VEEIVTGEAVVLDLPVARFPTRLLARLIDMVVQVAALLVITILASVASASSSLNSASLAAVFIAGIVVVIVGLPTAVETLSRGQTLGKLALGLRVVADDGGPVRFRQALVRALSGAVECWALVGIPALITSMLSARGKRLGDVFAGTFVVRVRAPRAAAPLPMEPALMAWASTLDMSGLPDPLAASAASYLSRYWQLDARVRDQLGWRLATDIAARVSPPPPPGLPPVAYLNAVLAQRHSRYLARLGAENWQPVVTPPVVTPPVVIAPPGPNVQPTPAPEVRPSADGGFAPPA
jgi:uncharacterized RDD family membrane protein YckC